MEDNKLWEGHRIILPEMREKAVHTCRDCCFLVEIQGRWESRPGCVAGIPRYGTLERRVPLKIHALDILKMAGREGLQAVLACGDPDSPACGLFRPRSSPGRVGAGQTGKQD
ncbi:hypothetical protein J2Z49_000441 [Desulfofundulus luciae]|uniref:Uncharacterized protein n=1 Tax=Desulfofundulus luciae TaxID=74702 RepID=A0ABU0AYL2_9FIRM|nr:hypothetical protein [Desulfofundulus luciae]MDQ0285348.1 hypothetical protein [Desulfofundulus luciae]